MPVLTQKQLDELNAVFQLGLTKNKRCNELAWESALRACEIGEYQIIPLTSSRALRQEGRAMKNCVGSYDVRCAAGICLVFSIRDLDDRRLATMSLDFGERGWRLGQIKGVANEEVCQMENTFFDGERTVTIIEPDDLHFVALEVVRCYRNLR